MARYSIEGSTLQGIANAIRETNGETDTYTPEEMIPAILSFKTGGSGIEELPDNLVYMGEEGESVTLSTMVTLQNQGGEAVAPRTDAMAVSMASGETVEAAMASVETAATVTSTNLASHTGNTSNPHSVTKSQVGLSKVNNNAISMSLSGTTLTISYS